MRRSRVLVPAAVLALLALSGVLAAHVRLRNPSNARALFWAGAPVRVVIQQDGSDDVPDESDDAAVRAALGDWNGVDGATPLLQEVVAPGQRARTDWARDDVHLIWFDEQNSSGYFPPGSAVVALTPLWFEGSGRLTDGDVLFNGAGFRFTTSGDPTAFDVQSIAAHELGHLLGLDHTGVAGATLYPYVARDKTTKRSLSVDDRAGLREIAPGATFGGLSGSVRRADGSPVAGALVVVRDGDGRQAGSTLSEVSGAFELLQLDPGTYELEATPLDYPVARYNLAPGRVIDTDFQSTRGRTLAVSPGTTVDHGDLVVGANTTMSLGRSQDELPLVAPAGQALPFTLRGTDLVPGSSLIASDPDLTVLPLQWWHGQVNFDLEVPAGEAPGLVDLIAIAPGGARSLLVGGIEIVPPPPAPVSVVPASSPEQGGIPLTLRGSAFRPGARVVLGGRLYADGDGRCTVLDESTIHLTPGATAGGRTDVVVLDPSGVEGRLIDAFEFLALPAVDTVFPATGSSQGGTDVVLTGINFQSGMVVRIDGVVQSKVVVQSEERAVVTTDGGVPGGPYLLEVQTPIGQAASAGFSFAPSPDPHLESVRPPRGRTSGGDVITLTGRSFGPAVEVWFGVDPDTGAGGVPAAALERVDPGTLRVTTPAGTQGSVALMVRDALTGQAHVLPSSYAFEQGRGLGGCSAGLSAPPFDAGRALAGAGWVLALMLVLALEARRLRGRAIAGQRSKA